MSTPEQMEGHWQDIAQDVLFCAIRDLKVTLNMLIPVPNVRTHNVALALDELIREAQAAWEEGR